MIRLKPASISGKLPQYIIEAVELFAVLAPHTGRA
jgi:hypothetical protein